MKYTENLNLRKPETTDYFDISDFNANWETLDEMWGDISSDLDDFEDKALGLISELTEQVNGMTKVTALSAEAYAALEEVDPETLYVVTSEESIALYYGSLPLKSASNTAFGSAALTAEAYGNGNEIGSFGCVSAAAFVAASVEEDT